MPFQTEPWAVREQGLDLVLLGPPVVTGIGDSFGNELAHIEVVHLRRDEPWLRWVASTKAFPR